VADAVEAIKIPASTQAAENAVRITPSWRGALVARAFLERNGGTDGLFPEAFQTKAFRTVYKFLTTRFSC
jgi:hypothetical protein